MTSDYATPILVLIGVVISSWLTYSGTTYRYRMKPKDPTTELFMYYDQMLKNMWQQNKEKDRLINNLEGSLDKIQQELLETKALLNETKAQLANATKQNLEVQKNITNAKKHLYEA